MDTAKREGPLYLPGIKSLFSISIQVEAMLAGWGDFKDMMHGYWVFGHIASVDRQDTARHETGMLTLTRCDRGCLANNIALGEYCQRLRTPGHCHIEILCVKSVSI